MDPTLFFQKCKQQYWGKLNEVKIPWVLVGASNSGHSMIAYLFRKQNFISKTVFYFLGQRWRKNFWSPLIDNPFNDDFWAKIPIFFFS